MRSFTERRFEWVFLSEDGRAIREDVHVYKDEEGNLIVDTQRFKIVPIGKAKRRVVKKY